MFVFVMGWALPALHATGQEKEDPADAQAKEAAKQFMQAMQKEDAEGMMKVVGVPFFWDGVKSIADREELKDSFAQVFAEKDLTKLEFSIKEVRTVDKAGGLLNEKQRELLAKVVEKTDRIVLVAIEDEGMAVMVRRRKDKSEVVGFRD
jgi:ABC-type glycerol-3-phosphate transport system substrate-binding protein